MDASPPEISVVVPVRDEEDNIDTLLAEIVAALFARGYRKLLIEGGARTISSFIDAGCINRLHLLVAPVIIGSGKAGLELEPQGDLSRALRPPTSVRTSKSRPSSSVPNRCQPVRVGAMPIWFQSVSS